jgi:uncharacterized coiled-coil protein SlyX
MMSKLHYVHPIELTRVVGQPQETPMSITTDPRELLERIETLEKRCADQENCMTQMAEAVHQNSIHQKKTYEALNMVMMKLIEREAENVIPGEVVYNA